MTEMDSASMKCMELQCIGNIWILKQQVALRKVEPDATAVKPTALLREFLQWLIGPQTHA